LFLKHAEYGEGGRIMPEGKKRRNIKRNLDAKENGGEGV